MNLSNRIHSRKVLYRLIYMLNFYKFFLSKSVYIDFAEKIENIVNLWFDKIDAKEFEKYNFTSLVAKQSISKQIYDLDDYISFFDVETKEFDEILSYILNHFLKARDWVWLEYDYISKNMKFLSLEYDSIIKNLDDVLESFKFHELNSVDQSILLLWYVENFSTKTPKWVIIKECLMLWTAFSSPSSTKLLNAVFDKVLN